MFKYPAKNIEQYLKSSKYLHNKFDPNNSEIGVSIGLAWTEFGGDTLPTETLAIPGKSELLITGRLGDVMKESAQIAYTYIKSLPLVEEKMYKDKTIHLHFPEGAIPKDGPSAGITIGTALFSLLTNKAVRHDVAMTGEISLKGKVLPIGGLKEKILAALRSGIKEIIIPKENKKDLDELSDDLKNPLKFHYVDNFNEVIDIVIKED